MAGLYVLRWTSGAQAVALTFVEALLISTELTSIPRILEILSANEWAGDDPADPNLDLDLDFLDDDELEIDAEHGFKLEANELEREMFGLSRAIHAGGGDGECDDFDADEGWGGSGRGGKGDMEDEEFQVQELERLMERIRGIRGMSHQCRFSVLSWQKLDSRHFSSATVLMSGRYGQGYAGG